MRNCEKFKTAEERIAEFNKICGPCEKADCNRCYALDCFNAWLDDEANEEKPLPCPVCGSPCVVVYNAVECTNKDGCAYRCWQLGFGADRNVAAHNRLARAVASEASVEVPGA